MIKVWNELVSGERLCHVSRGLKNRRHPIVYHGHDFCEVCWLDSGSGRHYLNKRWVDMPAGYLVMIRGSDSHGFEALPQETLNLVNIAFPISLIDRIMGRYFDETDRWFHKEGSMPFETVLDVMRQRQLTLAFDRLVASAQDNFAVDHFLMDLFQLCAPQTALHLGQALPDWLETAMRRYTGEEFVSGGLETFFRLAGRSPEHVSRVMRKELDTCPSEWINRKKIEYARRLLEVGSAPVVDVASEAGFENLSYFYRLFKKNYGVSPKRFRSEHNRLI